MSDLRHLLDEELTGDERALLEAARSDGPPDESGKARALKAVTAASLAATLATKTAATGAASQAARSAGGLTLKWQLVALSSLALVGGGALLALRPTAPLVDPRPASLPGAPSLAGPPPASPPASPLPEAASSRKQEPPAPPSASPAAQAPPALDAQAPRPRPSAEPRRPGQEGAGYFRREAAAGPAGSDGASLPEALPAPSAPALPAPSPAASAPAPAASAPAPAASGQSPSASTLADEAMALKEARRVLLSGDAGGALSLLDRYAARFPRGVLGAEALVLRIQALKARGDEAAAAELARAFLAGKPADAPYARRLRAMFPALAIP